MTDDRILSADKVAAVVTRSTDLYRGVPTAAVTIATLAASHEALRAENERLREALEAADECFTGYTLVPKDVTDRVERLRLITRDALGEDR